MPVSEIVPPFLGQSPPSRLRAAWRVIDAAREYTVQPWHA